MDERKAGIHGGRPSGCTGSAITIPEGHGLWRAWRKPRPGNEKGLQRRTSIHTPKLAALSHTTSRETIAIEMARQL